MIPAWARVGARVIAINDDGWKDVENNLASMPGPAYNEACLISGISFEADGVWLYLSGYPDFDTFNANRFKPAVTIEDDLEAHFTAILHQPSSIKEPAL